MIIRPTQLGYGAIAGAAAAAGGLIQKGMSAAKAVKKGVELVKEVRSETAKQSKKRKRTIQKVDTDCKRLEKRVKLLEKSGGNGVMIFRANGASYTATNANQVAYGEIVFRATSAIEDLLAQLRYYDPATPGTFVTAPAASGAQFKSFTFKKLYSSIKFRNNYQVPVKLSVYELHVRRDTSNLPSTCFTNWITDNLVNGAVTDPTVYPTDSTLLNELWSCRKVHKKTLKAGEAMVVSTTAKNFSYDPAVTDSHNLSYQVSCHCVAYYYRVEGLVGHGSTSGYGSSAAAVDLEYLNSAEIHYDAGADVKFVYSSNTFNSSGSVYIGAQPIPDNILYSVT